MHKVPEVQTDVTVLAFSLTLSRMFGIVVATVFVLEFSPFTVFAVSDAADIIAENCALQHRSSLGNVRWEVVEATAESRLDSGVNA